MTTLSELKLTPTQISALVVLMAEARKLTNAELEELAGFTLTGKDRSGLVDHDLIRSEKQDHLPRKPFAHELTEFGWRKIRELLRITAINGSGRSVAGALRVLMNALERGLQAQRLAPADFFYLDPEAETVVPQAKPDLEHAIRQAYKEIVTAPGDWVRLPKIRAAVHHASRADVDAALHNLALQQDVRIIPVANLKSLTPEDREAAVELGGELKHAIAIEG